MSSNPTGTLERMSWPIVLRSRSVAHVAGLPPAILTVAPGFRHESMPNEVGVLLPSNEGPKKLIDVVVQDPTCRGSAMLGLFLANPFLNVGLEGARLAAAGVGWVTNLPSVEQQDVEFSQQLADVALDHGRELDGLSQFRGLGLRIAAVVAGGDGAAAAAAIEPDAMIVMPGIADFAAGFPSLRQRGTAAQAVAQAARAAGWSGLILGLADAREADHEALWPDSLDGIVCRPVPE